VTLKQYLRELPLSIHNRTVASVLPTGPCPAGREHRRFTNAADDSTESYSVGSSELD
jgi:hypothetical protein